MEQYTVCVCSVRFSGLCLTLVSSMQAADWCQARSIWFCADLQQPDGQLSWNVIKCLQGSKYNKIIVLLGVNVHFKYATQ